MKYTKWNNSWKFWKDTDSFALVWNIPENASLVTLPHDALIFSDANAESVSGTSTGFRTPENYVYTKTFKAPLSWQGRITRVVFEGVYMNALVYINGQAVAKSPSGYATFTADLTPYLRYEEENELRVLVRAGAAPNSRWYSGAGIYRDVYLVQSEYTHIAQDGVQIITEEASDTSVIKAQITVGNKSQVSKELCVVTDILFDSKKVSEEKTKLFLCAGEERCIAQRISIENSKLWSAEEPDIYDAKVHLFDERGLEIDTVLETFGIRELSLSSKKGLRINGKEIKLRGACIHHDSGLLGAATYEEAQWRQVKLLKEAGFNAIRSAHQPMSPAMLRACDALGMYVMDEYSDMWTRPKSSFDYALHFEEWWKADVASMVKKDFNHPSVILYSVGNEIPEIGTDAGSAYAHKIAGLIHSLDSSRYTTAGINGIFASGDAIGKIISDVLSQDSNKNTGGNVNDFMTVMDTHLDQIVVHEEISKRLEKACASLDIAGYNYMRARYESDSKAYPNRVIVGSETYPPDIAKNWHEVKRLPSVIGDFTWTGWDYIGEAGVGIPAYAPGEGGFGAKFPAQLSYCGDIDITGYRRPLSYFREIVFGQRNSPYIAVQNPRYFGKDVIKTPWVKSDAVRSWDFEDCIGGKSIVEVYAPGDEVELFVNGISQGKKQSGEKAGFCTLFEVTVSRGTLLAVCYKGGMEIGKDELSSCRKAERIVLKAEDRVSPKDLSDNPHLVYVDIAVTDNNGTVATACSEEVSISTKGSCSLLGFGSADPKTLYNYTGTKSRLWQGRALAILKKEGEDASIEVFASNLLKATLAL